MEIEAKFRLVNPEATNIQIYVEVIEGCGFQIDCLNEPLQIVDTYFDTAQHTLRAKGAAIRLRRKGEKTLLTYKRKVAREGALHARVELEAESDTQQLRAVASELRQLGFPALDEGSLNLKGGKTDKLLATWGLIPTLEIMTARLRCEVSEGFHPVAIFVLDHVDFEKEERRGGYVGIEIEAVGEENTASVITISKALKVKLGEDIQEQDLSKYEFALGSLQ